MAAAHSDTTWMDDAYWFAFRGEIMHITKENVIKFPLLHNMVTSDMKGDFKGGVYHVNFDKDLFKIVYNFVVYGEKVSKVDHEKFMEIYDYFYCGEEIKTSVVIEYLPPTEKEIADIVFCVENHINVDRLVRYIYLQDKVTALHSHFDKIMIVKDEVLGVELTHNAFLYNTKLQ
jgi:hypothetical protein